MALTLYNKKRNFTNTPEPEGKASDKSTFRFVIQRHLASRLHYDFRLELGGVLKSWAVPKGPSLNPRDRRLAMMVEDHPSSYIGFEGTIPEGNYGAGTVMIWDSGTFTPVDAKHQVLSEKQALVNLANGELKFSLAGKKVNGEFVLVQLKKAEKGNAWLLIKHRDEHAVDVEYNSEDLVKASAKKKAAKPAGAVPQKTPVDTVRVAKQPATGKAPAKEGATAKNKKIVVDKHELSLTNLTKLYWPDDNITKGDLINFYDAISPIMLPYLKDRPLSLKRNPNGIKDKGFYHKDAGDAAPSWMKKADIHSGSNDKIIHYLVCNNKASLLYIANMGCIEINPWNSTTRKLDKPSYLVIDIDPSDKNTFDEVIETALVTRDVLEKAGAIAFCKTSGASGLHIYIPLGAKYTYDEVKDFGKQVATRIQQRLPATTSLERSLSKRGDKIYVDYLQNREGQTLASAYSVRPQPGATVSTPLEWKEVKAGLHPSQFTIFSLAKRLMKKDDLFRPVLGKGIDLTKCIKKLG